MPEYTYSDELYSDFHKDVYGFRPRGGGVHNWDNLTPAEKELAWTSMNTTMELHHQEEELRKDHDIRVFQKIIKSTINNGAKDFETALRWLMEADGLPLDGTYYPQDVEGFLWRHGICFTHYGHQISSILLTNNS